jgi:hypothetical protein
MFGRSLGGHCEYFGSCCVDGCVVCDRVVHGDWAVPPLKVIRSWPAVVPEGRNYVVDTLPRFVMDDYSYRGLGDYADDVLLIEWDMAIGKEDLDRLIDHVSEAPGRVLVTPYRVYQQTERPEMLPRPVWVHRRYNEGEQSMRHVDEGEPTCHLWGLGVTYLPRQVIRSFLAAWPGHFNDAAVSGWHYKNIEKETRIAWDVRPVHLHYPIERTVL